MLGLCGGYQMLGQNIADPLGHGGARGEVEGLGLLDVETDLTGDKFLRACAGVSTRKARLSSGYEMHVGRTEGPDSARPMLPFADGAATAPCRRTARSAPAMSMACSPTTSFARALLRWIGGQTSDLAYEAEVERTLDALADHLARHVDLDAFWPWRANQASSGRYELQKTRGAASSPTNCESGHATAQNRQRADLDTQARR